MHNEFRNFILLMKQLRLRLTNNFLFICFAIRNANVTNLWPRFGTQCNKRLHDSPWASPHRDNEYKYKRNTSASISSIDTAWNARQHSWYVAVWAQWVGDVVPIRYFPTATNSIDSDNDKHRASAYNTIEHHDGCVHAARRAWRDRGECDVNAYRTIDQVFNSQWGRFRCSDFAIQPFNMFHSSPCEQCFC